MNLFWADPRGASSNDYDLYVINDEETILSVSNNPQNGSQNPYEAIAAINTGDNVVVAKVSGENRFLHLNVGRGRLHLSTQGSTRGHNASTAANAFCVAATPVGNSLSGGFTGGSTNPVEDFSSDGPRRMFFDANGSALTPGNFSSTGGIVFNKPDITAADGVANSGVYGPGGASLTPFFGTSAAAPHAAAIAALLLSYNPLLTPAKIRSAMQDTALDIEASGWDRDSGYGIVMADRAMAAVFSGAGAVDPTFDTSFLALWDQVGVFALQADGKVLVGGDLNTDGQLARLNADGTIDTGFNTFGNNLQSFSSLALQPDGKMIIDGILDNDNGTLHNNLARLNPDGSRDPSYTSNFFVGSEIGSNSIRLTLQPDGKLLINGALGYYMHSGFFTRLDSDGSLDTSFSHPLSESSGYLYQTLLQQNGKVIIRNFVRTEPSNHYSDSYTRIARVNSDGSFDTGFSQGSGFARDVVGNVVMINSLALQADGKILIGGVFDSYNGTPCKHLARLNPDGSIDASFDPDMLGPVGCIALQADGKMLIGGRFSSYAGTPRNSLVRLNPDGSLDGSFDSGIFADGWVFAIHLQADGKVLIDGGYPRYIARLVNDPATGSLAATGPHRVQWLRGGAAPEILHVRFENSPDGLAWTPLGAGTRISGGWELTGLNLSGSGYLRAHGRPVMQRDEEIRADRIPPRARAPLIERRIFLAYRGNRPL